MIETGDFHFLRPAWFLLVPVTLVLAFMVRNALASASAWEKVIDPALLSHLLVKPTGQSGRNPYLLLFIAWLIAITALAGPAWQKTPQPIHEREDAVVIILDLTRSMYATDVSPNRLVRARRKLMDLLQQRTEGVTGLVVFSGGAHTVSPLTDDANTISSMVPALTPEIMPAPGSQLAPAIEIAVKLFQDAGVTSGRILVVTDEIRDLAQSQAFASDHSVGYPVSVLAVGTAEGAPVPIVEEDEARGYLKDDNGNLVIPGVNLTEMRTFANLAGGRFAQMTLTDSDLDYLLAPDPWQEEEIYRELEREFDIWEEEGPWLLLLLLPIAALAFRRGWLWMAIVLVLPVDHVNADTWDDIWQTRDQQGYRALDEGDAATASLLFEDPAWQAAAQYRDGDFEAAADGFAGLDSADGTYNLGNALARSGNYADAIAAYDRVLDAFPDHEDAAFNRALIEDLMEQQQQQQQQEQQQDQQSEGDDNEGEDNPSEEQNPEQQPGEENEDPSSSDESASQEEQAEQQEEEGRERSEEQQEGEAANATTEDGQLDDEEQQSLQQWLRRVPDDPGGLLRRKFEQQYVERLKRGEAQRSSRGDW